MSFVKSLKRSWRHHFGIQLSTLVVLCGAFSVIISTVLVSQNLTRVLSSWGESLQITAYLDETVDEAQLPAMQNNFRRITSVKNIEFIDKKEATEKFREQMASFAPGLLNDADFANPFPSSFRITLNEGSKPELLKEVSEQLRTIAGVEEVSYGQSWIENYSVFASVISHLGQGLMILLLAGGLMIVGNAVRASVATRREEIEILELVGATKQMIRSPFLIEGALMGTLAVSIALLVNYIFFEFISALLSKSLGFMRFAEVLSFASAFTVIILLLSGALVGFVGAYFAVRGLNDGWSASRRSRV